MKKKVLVIGNDGYIGAVLVPILQKEGLYEVHGKDVMWFGEISSTTFLPKASSAGNAFSDIRDTCTSDFEGFHAIIMLAAVSNDPMGNKFEEVTRRINEEATLEVASKGKQAGVERFIFASSCSVYGISDNEERKEGDLLKPLTAYAKSKVLVEEGLERIASNNFNATCLRFATAGGASPRLRLDLVLNDFVASAITNNYIEILSDGTPWRPLIHTEDMSRAIIWAIERELGSKDDNFLIINVGSKDWTFSMKSLAEKVSKCLNDVDIKINPEGLPDPRSYKVDFSLFKKLAPNYQPKKDINVAVLELAEQIRFLKIDKHFRSSEWIRLNHLTSLISRGLLDMNLKWRKKL